MTEPWGQRIALSRPSDVEDYIKKVMTIELMYLHAVDLGLDKDTSIQDEFKRSEQKIVGEMCRQQLVYDKVDKNNKAKDVLDKTMAQLKKRYKISYNLPVLQELLLDMNKTKEGMAQQRAQRSSRSQAPAPQPKRNSKQSAPPKK